MFIILPTYRPMRYAQLGLGLDETNSRVALQAYLIGTFAWLKAHQVHQVR